MSGSLQGSGGVGGLLSVTEDDGSSYYPSIDGNGNITGYIDDSGVVKSVYVFDAFGGILSSSGSKVDDFKFRFSSKYQDAETSFNYYGYRYYDAEMGRWLNRDPIGELGAVSVFYADNIHSYNADGGLAEVVYSDSTNSFTYYDNALLNTASNEQGIVTNIFNLANRLGNRYLWQGREYSWKTGLYYFRARWYDPVVGRWLSKDPIGISGGLNQYVFCGNNPVNFRDPRGLILNLHNKNTQDWRDAEGGGKVYDSFDGGMEAYRVAGHGYHYDVPEAERYAFAVGPYEGGGNGISAQALADMIWARKGGDWQNYSNIYLEACYTASGKDGKRRNSYAQALADALSEKAGFSIYVTSAVGKGRYSPHNNKWVCKEDTFKGRPKAK